MKYFDELEANGKGKQKEVENKKIKRDKPYQLIEINKANANKFLWSWERAKSVEQIQRWYNQGLIKTMILNNWEDFE